jgi:YD repeat-containing protein
VNVSSGNWIGSFTDFGVAGGNDSFGLIRHLNTGINTGGIFGPGFRTGVESFVKAQPSTSACETDPKTGGCWVELVESDGATMAFVWDSGAGEWEAPGGLPIKFESGQGEVTITYPDGTRHHFEDDVLTGGKVSKITGWSDLDEHRVTLVRDPVYGDNPVTIRDEVSGREITLTYQNHGSPGSPVWLVSKAHVMEGTEEIARTYSYAWGHLYEACGPDGVVVIGSGTPEQPEVSGCQAYLWNFDTAQVITVEWPNQQEDLLTLTYDDEFRVATLTNPAGDVTGFDYDAFPATQTVVTDGRGQTLTYQFDAEGRQVRFDDGLNHPTAYSYSADGWRVQTIDANANLSQLSYDPDGNLLSVNNGAGELTTYRYEPANYAAGAPEPARTGPSHHCDPRQQDPGAGSDQYCTEMTYDDHGRMVTRAEPGETPSTREEWAYTDGSEAAPGGGTMPEGLLESYFDGIGTTSYAYDTDGNLVNQTSPLGAVTEFTYDDLGRVVTESVTYDTNPAQVVNTITYDGLRMVSETGPVVTNQVSLEQHQLEVEYKYDNNGNLTQQWERDAAAGPSEPWRKTVYTFDEMDREISVEDPELNVTSRTYDENGNVISVTDPEGNTVETAYDNSNRPAEVTATDFDDGHGTTTDRVLRREFYDPAGRLVETEENTAAGQSTETRHVYDTADRLIETRVGYTWAASTPQDVTVLRNTYDAYGFLTETVSGNADAGSGPGQDRHVTTYTYYDNGRVHTETVNGRTTTYTYDPAGNVTSQVTEAPDGADPTVTTTSAVTTTYNPAGLPVETTVENGTEDLVTTTTYDQRGLAVSVTSPRGNATGATPADYTTDTTYDVLGRPVTIELAPVDTAHATDPGSGVEATWTTTNGHRPTSNLGYDAFANPTHETSPNGHTTVTTYDDLDRRAGVTHPDYTPPGESVPLTATETWAYTPNGNVASYTDRAGDTTTYEYDDANQVVRTIDPRIPEPGNDSTLQAAGITEQHYDWVGRLVGTKDPEGGEVGYAYDSLGRLRAETTTVREELDPATQAVVQPAMTGITSYEYSWLGYETQVNNGATTRARTYNAFGDVVTERTGTLAPTVYTYDGLSRPAKIDNPDGTAVAFTYDQAGRQITETFLDSTGGIVGDTATSYDADGNVLTATSPRGFDTTNTYNAVGDLTSVTQPVDGSTSITTTYTHDAGGNPTSYTDGDGHTFRYAYNSYELRTHVVEPSATTSPVEPETDRAFLTIYDAAGRPVGETQPGGREVFREFNAMGLPEEESWVDPGAVFAAGKEWGYDTLGRTVWGSHPDEPVEFSYDDRGLLVAADGGAGTTRVMHDPAGREIGRLDESGTQLTSYDPNGLIDAVTHAEAGATSLYPGTKQITVNAAAGAGEPTYGLSVDGAVSTETATIGDPVGVFGTENFPVPSTVTVNDVTVTFGADPAHTGSVVQVIAVGRVGGENIELQIDGTVVDAWVLDADTSGFYTATPEYRTYTYVHDTEITDQDVKVRFTNNGGLPDKDVRIDAIIVDGTRYESEDPQVWSNSGVYVNGGLCNPGAWEAEFLHCTGYFDYPVDHTPNATTGSTIEITATGRVGGENIELQIDGATVDTFVLDGDLAGFYGASPDYDTYTYTHPALITAEDIRIEFTNNGGPPDKDVRIDAIVIDGTRYESEHPDVYSNGGVYVNGGLCTPGNWEAEFLHCNGYFQYPVDQPPPPPPGTSTIEVISVGHVGGENLEFRIDDITVDSWTLTAPSGGVLRPRPGIHHLHLHPPHPHHRRRHQSRPHQLPERRPRRPRRRGDRGWHPVRVRRPRRLLQRVGVHQRRPMRPR